MFEILGEENLKAMAVQASIHSVGVHLTQSCSLSYLEATSQLTTASHSPCSLWEPEWLLAFGFEKSRKSVLKKKKTKQNKKQKTEAISESEGGFTINRTSPYLAALLG